MIGYSDSNKDVGYLASAWGVRGAQMARRRPPARARCALHVLPRPRRRAGPRRRPHERRDPGPAAGHGRGPHQADRAGRGHRRQVLDSRDRPPRAGAGRRRRARVASAAAAHGRAAARLRGAARADGGRSQRGLSRSGLPPSRLRRASSSRRRRSRRSRGCGSAHVRRGAAAHSGSRSCARSPGCSHGRRPRIILPGWYGLGSALAQAREEAGLPVLQEMDRDWPFFAALLSNAEMALAKADLTIGERYAGLVRGRDAARGDLGAASARSTSARASWCWRSPARRGSSTARRCFSARSSAATRTSTRSRSSRSSCCAACARDGASEELVRRRCC